MKEIKYTRFAIALYCGIWIEVQNVRDTRAVFRNVSKICKRENTRIKLIEVVYPDGREVYWRNHYTSGSRSRAIDTTPFHVKLKLKEGASK